MTARCTAKALLAHVHCSLGEQICGCHFLRYVAQLRILLVGIMRSCTYVTRLVVGWHPVIIPLLLFAYLLLPPLPLLHLLPLPLLLLLTIIRLLLSLLLSKFRMLPSCCRWTAPSSLFLLHSRPTVGTILLVCVLHVRLRLRLWCWGRTGVAVHNLASDNTWPA